jgi:hypothetical protein
MRMRLAYCAAAVSPSSADAYYENASFVCVPSPYRPHLLYYSSITNWIGIVPCLSGFLVIMSCALYCRRNRCTNITEGGITIEMLKRAHWNLWLAECTLKERSSLAQQPPLTSLICLIVPVIQEEHGISIILQAALTEMFIDVPKQEYPHGNMTNLSSCIRIRVGVRSLGSPVIQGQGKQSAVTSFPLSNQKVSHSSQRYMT